MKININTKDVEDWTAKDFCLFIKQQLELKGISYQIKYPTDIIAIGVVLKMFRKQDKSNHALVKYVKQILEDYLGNVQAIQSLHFIRIFALSDCQKTSFAEKKRDKKAKFKSKPIHDSPPMSCYIANWLQSIKPSPTV